MGKFGKKRSLDDEPGSESDRETKPAPKKAKGSGSLQSGQDAEGNPYWEIAPKRRVGVSTFKSNTFINIREYYEADGEMKPGKKGISLTLDQYQALLRAVPAINAKLRESGHEVHEVNPAGASGTAAPKPKAQTAVAKSRKANIDATSDEDSS